MWLVVVMVDDNDLYWAAKMLALDPASPKQKQV